MRPGSLRQDDQTADDEDRQDCRGQRAAQRKAAKTVIAASQGPGKGQFVNLAKAAWCPVKRNDHPAMVRSRPSVLLGVPLLPQRLSPHYPGHRRTNGFCSGARLFHRSGCVGLCLPGCFGAGDGHHREHLRRGRRATLDGLHSHRSRVVGGCLLPGHGYLTRNGHFCCVESEQPRREISEDRTPKVGRLTTGIILLRV
jgi:hypothetical protein